MFLTGGDHYVAIYEELQTWCWCGGDISCDTLRGETATSEIIFKLDVKIVMIIKIAPNSADVDVPVIIIPSSVTIPSSPLDPAQPSAPRYQVPVECTKCAVFDACFYTFLESIAFVADLICSKLYGTANDSKQTNDKTC